MMSVAFSPSKPVIASGGADQMVRLWHVDSLTQFDHPLNRHNETVEGVAFNADGTRWSRPRRSHRADVGR